MPASLNLVKWLKSKIIIIEIIIVIIIIIIRRRRIRIIRIITHLFFFSGATLHLPMYTLASSAIY